MGWYYNRTGQRFDLPERPLEPPEGPIRAAWPWVSKSHVRVDLDKKTAPSAANTEDGRAEQTLTGPDSASYDTEN